jgi:hypothetical protein
MDFPRPASAAASAEDDNIFNLGQRPGDDECAVSARVVQNVDINDYQLFDSRSDGLEESTRDLARRHRNLRISEGEGGPSQALIDHDSMLRNGKGWNPRGRSVLNTRVYVANADFTGGTQESKAEEASLVWSDASADRAQALSGVTIDRFEPQIQCIRDTVQNPEHIVEKWVRGGQDTRAASRTPAYLAGQGFHHGPKGEWVMR